MKDSNILKISIVIPMRNSSSTIEETLKSIKKQIYPVREIIIVDNASTDNSVEVVRKFAEKNKKMIIKLLPNKKDLMIARSLSRGVRAAKNPYIVLTHSDCRFITAHELGKLIKPFSKKNIVATYGQIKQSLSIWNHYSFWEKFLFAYQAGKTIPGLVGKVDCIKKAAYLKAGGHDTVGHDNYGGEDADLHARLKRIGLTQETKATIEHLHYTYSDFSFKDLLEKKKQTAGAYGVLLKDYGFKNGVKGLATFLLKPCIAVSLLIPVIQIPACMVFLAFVVLYYYRMFITYSTITNYRVILVPFAVLFLIYYETFWTAAALIRRVSINEANA